jgi:large subunit ribosomal protein L24
MPLMSNPYPIAADAVRLVFPIKNADTGLARDVIINELKPARPDMSSKHMTLDRWEHGYKWDRVALGVNVVIPWPEVEVPEYTTHEADTARDLVEDRTFYYNLTSSPIPNGVINELRGPYSRFRTRHEAWYIAKKEAEEAEKKGRHALLETMRTPLDELHEKERAEREAAGEPELSEELLEKIGQVMAKNKAEALARAGMEEASATQPPSSVA